MSKQTLLTIAVITLLLLNLGTLFFLLGRERQHMGPPGRPPGPPDAFIIEKLQLDPEQQMVFEGLKKEHHGQMQELGRQTRELQHSLFELLQQSTQSKTAVDSLAMLMGQIQSQRVQLTYAHFSKLRELCRPEQKRYFDAFMEDISVQVMQQPHRKH